LALELSRELCGKLGDDAGVRAAYRGG
jgi:hypothetical protein